MDIRRKLIRLASFPAVSLRSLLRHGEIFGFVIAWAVGLVVVFSAQPPEKQSTDTSRFAAVTGSGISPVGIKPGLIE